MTCSSAKRMKGDIDEGLYSRQLYVLGHSAMKRLTERRVLVSGLGGVGVEIAKNIILSGVGSVCLNDVECAVWKDLSGQYYLNESSLGKNRAVCSYEGLSGLNGYVELSVSTKELSEELLSEFDVVVVSERQASECIWVDEYCRGNNIKFIMANSFGLFGQLFVDLGDEFCVLDSNGVKARTCIVTNIDSDGVVLLHDDHFMDLQDGDFVTFSEVRGMTELNTRGPFQIRFISPHSFSIGDLSSLGEYLGGGIVHPVKMPTTLHFTSLAHQLDQPTLLDSTASSLHQSFRTLDWFVRKYGRFPGVWSEEDAQLFGGGMFAKCCDGHLCPVDSIIGSLASQEVIKACTGKFTPVVQWLYYDGVLCLPEGGTASEGRNRYHGQSCILGEWVQSRLGSLNTFIVGMGAIGCELLKNLCMMGVSCGGGRTVITDMDRIEKSNLNRQFLFRPSDVLNAKSTTAARAIGGMNPDMNITALEYEVGQQTDDLFDDSFYNSMDIVLTALDKVEARRFVDSKCIYYRLPMIDSGTMGAKGHCQPVIPHLTESYSSTNDPTTVAFPFCTVRHFPNTIEHCIQYACDVFAGVFFNDPHVASKYDGGVIPTDLLPSLKSVFVDCHDYPSTLIWAIKHFVHNYTNSIAQLLHNFPPHATTTRGIPFWSPPKRCPTPIHFDPHNTHHLRYVLLASRLRAQSLGIPVDEAIAMDVISRFKVDEFVPLSGVTIPETDEQLDTTHPPAHSSERLKVWPISASPIEYDKDDPIHAEFVTIASNLRAQNYDIPPTSIYNTKLVSGKIVPAMATTTSLVVGLVCMELIKVVQQRNKIDSYCTTYADTALSQILSCTPIECPVFNYLDKFSWTLWDRVEIDQPMTLSQLLAHLTDHYRVKADVISQGDITIFSFFMDKNKRKQRLGMEITDIVSSIINKDIPSHLNYIVLDTVCSSVDGSDDVDLPFINYKIRR